MFRVGVCVKVKGGKAKQLVLHILGILLVDFKGSQTKPIFWQGEQPYLSITTESCGAEYTTKTFNIKSYDYDDLFGNVEGQNAAVVEVEVAMKFYFVITTNDVTR